MNPQKTPPTTETVNEIFDRYEQECLDEFVPRTAKESRRHFLYLRAEVGPQGAVAAELRAFAKKSDIRKAGTGHMRRLAVVHAALTIAVRRWFSVKASFLREVDQE